MIFILRYVQTDCELPELAFNTTLIAVQVGVEEGDPREHVTKNLKFIYNRLNSGSM